MTLKILLCRGIIVFVFISAVAAGWPAALAEESEHAFAGFIKPSLTSSDTRPLSPFDNRNLINSGGHTHFLELTPQSGPLAPELIVLYKNGTYIENKNWTWDGIHSSNISKVGIRKADLGKAELQLDYGTILWHPLHPETGEAYDIAAMFISQRFWRKPAGEAWDKFYIISDRAATPAPFFSKEKEDWTIGWKGSATYAGLNFPVSLGIASAKGKSWSFKTQVTTPINLENHGLEYQFNINPALADDAARNIKYVRFFYRNGKEVDYDINLAAEVREITDLLAKAAFLTKAKVLVNSVDFEDVFAKAKDKYIRIGQVTLPDGQATYGLHIAAFFGPLAAGETMTIDPTFGYNTSTENYWPLKTYRVWYQASPSTSGYVDKMTLLLYDGLGNESSRSIYGGLYDNSGNRLTKGVVTTAVTPLSTDVWVDIDMESAPAVTGGTNYWLLGTGTTQVVHLKQGPSCTTSCKYNQSALPLGYGAPPATLPTETGTWTNAWAMYATYYDYKTTFNVSGIGADTGSATVVTVNTKTKTKADLPYEKATDSVTYSFASPITGTGNTYYLKSISGCGQTTQSATFTPSSVCTVTATYLTTPPTFDFEGINMQGVDIK